MVARDSDNNNHGTSNVSLSSVEVETFHNASKIIVNTQQLTLVIVKIGKLIVNNCLSTTASYCHLVPQKRVANVLEAAG